MWSPPGNPLFPQLSVACVNECREGVDQVPREKRQSTSTTSSFGRRVKEDVVDAEMSFRRSSMREAARRECWAARFCLRVSALRHASLGHVDPEPPLFHRMAFALLRSPRPAQTPAWNSCTPSQFFRPSVVHDMVAYCNELEFPCISTAMS